MRAEPASLSRAVALLVAAVVPLLAQDVRRYEQCADPLGAAMLAEARDHVATSVKSISAGRTTVIVNHVGSEVFDPDIILHIGSGMVTDKITFRNRQPRVAPIADGA